MCVVIICIRRILESLCIIQELLCNLFLADEINRTSPKTQSALLEVMEEGTVTIDAVKEKCNHLW